METRLVLLAGIAAGVAGSLAMGIGAYLASKSQRDFFESEKARERREIEEFPELERKEIRDIFTKLGFLKEDRKSTRLNSSHDQISYAVFCLKKKTDTACIDHP